MFMSAGFDAYVYEYMYKYAEVEKSMSRPIGSYEGGTNGRWFFVRPIAAGRCSSQ